MLSARKSFIALVSFSSPGCGRHAIREFHVDIPEKDFVDLPRKVAETRGQGDRRPGE
jgi:hypothetical protein